MKRPLCPPDPPSASAPTSKPPKSGGDTKRPTTVRTPSSGGSSSPVTPIGILVTPTGQFLVSGSWADSPVRTPVPGWTHSERALNPTTPPTMALAMDSPLGFGFGFVPPFSGPWPGGAGPPGEGNTPSATPTSVPVEGSSTYPMWPSSMLGPFLYSPVPLSAAVTATTATATTAAATGTGPTGGATTAATSGEEEEEEVSLEVEGVGVGLLEGDEEEERE